MSEFIQVGDGEGGTEFISVDKIVRVACSVSKRRKGGGLEALSLVDPTYPPTTPVEVLTSVSIRLFTANGDGEVLFDSESEADIWAEQNLEIDDITARSQKVPN